MRESTIQFAGALVFYRAAYRALVFLPCSVPCTSVLPCSVPCIHVHDMVTWHGTVHGMHLSMLPWHARPPGDFTWLHTQFCMFKLGLKISTFFHIEHKPVRLPDDVIWSFGANILGPTRQSGYRYNVLDDNTHK